MSAADDALRVSRLAREMISSGVEGCRAQLERSQAQLAEREKFVAEYREIVQRDAERLAAWEEVEALYVLGAHAEKTLERANAEVREAQR